MIRAQTPESGNDRLMSTWLGVDVGGVRKGFDVAVIDDTSVLRLEQRRTREQVLAIVSEFRPEVTAIDSPRRCADDGQTTRPSEIALNKDVCGIRWTPDHASVHAGEYYAWIVEGLRLYDALCDGTTELIEVFPTASWTRWCGERGDVPRSAWSTKGLAMLDLAGVPKRSNQDQRDAIAAAVTARQYSAGNTETFGGEIVVPQKCQRLQAHRYGPIEMPEQFVLECLTGTGSWSESGRFPAELFAREDDGSYVCSGHGGSPVLLRCLRQDGDVIYVVDGAGDPYTYRLVQTPGRA